MQQCTCISLHPQEWTNVSMYAVLIQKMYLTNYELFLKEQPKAVRNIACKLMMHQTPIPQHSFDTMKSTFNQTILKIIKRVLQRKLQQYSQNYLKQHTLRTIHESFFLKMKLYCLFKELNQQQAAGSVLSLLYQQLYNNQKAFLTQSTARSSRLSWSSVRSNNAPTTVQIPYPPYLYSYEAVQKLWGTPSNYLHILTYVFLQLITHLGGRGHSFVEGLKVFLNRSSQITTMEQDLCHNLWVVTVVEYGLRVCGNNVDEVGLASLLRNTVEIIGSLMYKFNPCLSFPRIMKYQLRVCMGILNDTLRTPIALQDMSQSVNSVESESIQESPMRESLEIEGNTMQSVYGGKTQKHYRIRRALEEQCCSGAWLMMQSFSGFKAVYLHTLLQLQRVLIKASCERISASIGLSVLKCVVVLFNGKVREQAMEWRQDNSKEENEVRYAYYKEYLSWIIQEIELEVPLRIHGWPQLQSLEQLYKFTLRTVSNRRDKVVPSFGVEQYVRYQLAADQNEEMRIFNSIVKEILNEENQGGEQSNKIGELTVENSQQYSAEIGSIERIELQQQSIRICVENTLVQHCMLFQIDIVTQKNKQYTVQMKNINIIVKGDKCQVIGNIEFKTIFIFRVLKLRALLNDGFVAEYRNHKKEQKQFILNSLSLVTQDNLILFLNLQQQIQYTLQNTTSFKRQFTLKPLFSNFPTNITHIIINSISYIYPFKNDIKLSLPQHSALAVQIYLLTNIPLPNQLSLRLGMQQEGYAYQLTNCRVLTLLPSLTIKSMNNYLPEYRMMNTCTQDIGFKVAEQAWEQYEVLHPGQKYNLASATVLIRTSSSDIVVDLREMIPAAERGEISEVSLVKYVAKAFEPVEISLADMHIDACLAKNQGFEIVGKTKGKKGKMYLVARKCGVLKLPILLNNSKKMQWKQEYIQIM